MTQAAPRDEDKVLAALARLPIFPLPGAVLLPHGLVPLHVFEERYRHMMRDCLAGGGVLALAQLSPASEAFDEDPPRVLPVVGAGVFDHVEPLPDGRFNLILRGVVRARILEELPAGKPYRVVSARLLAEDPDETGSADVLASAETLRRMVLSLCGTSPGPGAQRLMQLLAKARDPSALADVVGATLVESPRERQWLLEELSAGKRLARVTARTAGLLARALPRPSDKTMLN